MKRKNEARDWRIAHAADPECHVLSVPRGCLHFREIFGHCRKTKKHRRQRGRIEHLGMQAQCQQQTACVIHRGACAHRKPHFDLSPTQKEAWSNAVKLSKKSPYTFLADFLDPVSTFKFARYGKFGRLHYDKTKEDMTRVAGNFAKVMVTAGELKRSPDARSAQQLANMRTAFDAIRGNPAVSGELADALEEIAPGQGQTLFGQIDEAISSGAMLDPWTRLLVGTVYQASLTPPDGSDDAPPGGALLAAHEANHSTVYEVLEDARTVVDQKLEQLALQARRDAPLTPQQRLDLRYATDKIKVQIGVLDNYAPIRAALARPMLAHLEAVAAGTEALF